MKLTDKCLADFTKWAFDKYGLTEDNFTIALETTLNALIIEFFDSVQVYIQNWAFVDFVESEDPGFDCSVYFDKVNHDSDIFFDTRLQAINSAIEKANELYNEKHK